nr:glutamate-rich protein 5 isoform X2 [Pelodiscus sinensis]|eukprot:XP_014429485.1 glutamate-rich protein 5 isoform X2 [Pelodiscus sinensis]
MGCSSSTQTQTQDSNRPAAKPSDTNGLQKCDENSPITEENETIPDQTKLDSMEEVDLTPEETKPSENLPAKETEVLIPATAECVNSDYKREDLEGIQPLAAEPLDGTEPQVKQIEIPPPVGPAEGTGIPPPAGPAEGTGIPPPAGPAEGTGIPPPAGPAEGTGIPPPAGPAEGTGIPPPAGPAEGTGIPPPAGPAEGTGILLPAGPAEGSVHPVTEVIWKVKSNKEDQLIEGNICAFADLGYQILPSETCVQVLLTSVDAVHEYVRAEFSPPIFYKLVCETMYLGKTCGQKSKL